MSVLITGGGSALRARVRAGDTGVVARALAIVRDDAAATLEAISAVSGIKRVGPCAEGEIELELAEPVSRRGLRRVALLNERSMRRLGYVLEREVVADGGQVVSVYARQRRHHA
ncbi:hypothetical protein [Skermanella pratensis]|uniref:hypothetical protein n=1 Tax=Skermanella pratensis TaxID=2233999 RepID=UPI001300FCF0|nr:hypothetical protein [Skermanella pratensis]